MIVEHIMQLSKLAAAWIVGGSVLPSGGAQVMFDRCADGV